jgi:hypothetical protein
MFAAFSAVLNLLLWFYFAPLPLKREPFAVILNMIGEIISRRRGKGAKVNKNKIIKPRTSQRFIPVYRRIVPAF